MKLMRFDPTFNMGNIVQIIVMIASVSLVYTTIRTEQVQQKADLAAVKEASDIQRTTNSEVLKDIKNDIRTMQATMSDVKESLGILRAKAQAQTK